MQFQDLLGLGSEARINVPGVAEGNWNWRLLPDQADGALAEEIRGRKDLEILEEPRPLRFDEDGTLLDFMS